MNVYSLIVTAYFLFIILISLLTRRLASRSSADYLIAGRNLGVIVCAVVVAAEWLGGMSTIGVSEKAYTTGTMQPVLYNISTALGMVIIGFTAARHYRRKHVHTVSEMMESLFGRKVRTISAFCFLLAYITLAYVQLQTCASVVSGIFGLSWVSAVLISSLVITLYTYFGGMHALAITGIIHVIVMFTGIGFALAAGLIKIGSLAALKLQLVAGGSPSNLFNPFSAGIGYATSLLLGGVLGGMAGQASIQPIFAARTPEIARKAALVSALIVAPFGIMVALLGLMARSELLIPANGVVNPKLVLPLLLTSSRFIPPVLGGIALAGVLAAILSTAGPVNFAIVTIAAKDLYQGVFRREATDSGILHTARNLVILVNIFTLPLAIFIRSAILDAAYVSYAIRAIGAIVIIMGLYARGLINQLSVKLAFTGGTLVIFLCIIGNKLGWFQIDKTIAAVVSALIFLAIGRLLGRRQTVNEE